MLKFWEKTKNAVTIGINNIQEATGNQSLQEDASYIEISSQIKDAKDKLEKIQKSAKEFAKYIEKMTTSQYELACHISSLFKEGESSFNVAAATKQAQEVTYTNSRNLSGYYIDQQVVNRVKELQKELEPISEADKKRKKNHILLDDAQKDLEKAKSKGKVKEMGEIQEKVAKRQAKYAQYDEKFNTLAKAFLAKAPQAYEEIYNAYQFYVAQFYEEGKKQAIDVVPDYKYASQKGKYPSITELPPVEEKPKEEETPSQP